MAKKENRKKKKEYIIKIEGRIAKKSDISFDDSDNEILIYDSIDECRKEAKRIDGECICIDELNWTVTGAAVGNAIKCEQLKRVPRHAKYFQMYINSDGLLTDVYLTDDGNRYHAMYRGDIYMLRYAEAMGETANINKVDPVIFKVKN